MSSFIAVSPSELCKELIVNHSPQILVSEHLALLVVYKYMYMHTYSPECPFPVSPMGEVSDLVLLVIDWCVSPIEVIPILVKFNQFKLSVPGCMQGDTSQKNLNVEFKFSLVIAHTESPCCQYIARVSSLPYPHHSYTRSRNGTYPFSATQASMTTLLSCEHE